MRSAQVEGTERRRSARDGGRGEDGAQVAVRVAGPPKARSVVPGWPTPSRCPSVRASADGARGMARCHGRRPDSLDGRTAAPPRNASPPLAGRLGARRWPEGPRAGRNGGGDVGRERKAGKVGGQVDKEVGGRLADTWLRPRGRCGRLERPLCASVSTYDPVDRNGAEKTPPLRLMWGQGEKRKRRRGQHRCNVRYAAPSWS